MATSSSNTEQLTASELTQNTMFSDLTQQRGLLIGAGVALAALFLFSRRQRPPEAQAARRLVRDWRKVDDAEDARDLLGSNLLTIARPALLLILEEVENQVHHGFRQAERQIKHL
jgi:hypothetical protein